MDAESLEALFTEVLSSCERELRAGALHLVYHYR